MMVLIDSGMMIDEDEWGRWWIRMMDEDDGWQWMRMAKSIMDEDDG